MLGCILVDDFYHIMCPQNSNNIKINFQNVLGIGNIQLLTLIYSVILLLIFLLFLF